MTVTVDVGSHYIWMARHFRSYEPRHLLFSNGMQTLGVALPWAISVRAGSSEYTNYLCFWGRRFPIFGARIRNSGSVKAKYRAYYLE